MTDPSPELRAGTPARLAAALADRYLIERELEPVTARRPTVSPPLGAVIMRALEKRPADRWQTADEMLATAEPLLTPSGGMTPTETRPVAAVAGPKRNRFGMLIDGALLLVAALVALAFLTLRHRPPPTAALLRAAQVTRNAGIQELPVITPDGKSVAYTMVAPGDSLERIELRRSDGGGGVTLDSNAAPLSWSPGGDHLLVVTDRGSRAFRRWAARASCWCRRPSLAPGRRTERPSCMSAAILCWHGCRRNEQVGDTRARSPFTGVVTRRKMDRVRLGQLRIPDRLEPGDQQRLAGRGTRR